MLNILTCCTFTASAMIVPLLLLKNIVDGFLCAKFRIVDYFTVFSTLRERRTLPSAQVSFEHAQQYADEQENDLEMVWSSSNTSMRRLSTSLAVS
jgi:hypothetical protein